MTKSKLFTYIKNSELLQLHESRSFTVNSDEETIYFIEMLCNVRDNDNFLNIIINKYVGSFLSLRAMVQCLRYIYNYEIIYNGNLDTEEGFFNDKFIIKINDNTYYHIIITLLQDFTLINEIGIDKIYFHNLNVRNVFNKIEEISLTNTL
jgi:hypothetical protein